MFASRVLRLRLITRVVGAAGLAIGLALWASDTSSRSEPPPAAGSAPVPVMTQPAVTATVPTYLEALGTVQASALVTVRSQVDGMLQEIRFREGQDVKTGEVLARIDPRIYKAQLDQAVARQVQDQKALANDTFGLVQKAQSTQSTTAQFAAQVQQD